MEDMYNFLTASAEAEKKRKAKKKAENDDQPDESASVTGGY